MMDKRKANSAKRMEREAAWLRKLEAAVTLDVLTAGWFGARSGSRER